MNENNRDDVILPEVAKGILDTEFERLKALNLRLEGQNSKLEGQNSKLDRNNTQLAKRNKLISNLNRRVVRANNSLAESHELMKFQMEEARSRDRRLYSIYFFLMIALVLSCLTICWLVMTEGSRLGRLELAVSRKAGRDDLPPRVRFVTQDENTVFVTKNPEWIMVSGLSARFTSSSGQVLVLCDIGGLTPVNPPGMIGAEFRLLVDGKSVSTEMIKSPNHGDFRNASLHWVGEVPRGRDIPYAVEIRVEAGAEFVIGHGNNTRRITISDLP